MFAIGLIYRPSRDFLNPKFYSYYYYQYLFPTGLQLLLLFDNIRSKRLLTHQSWIGFGGNSGNIIKGLSIFSPWSHFRYSANGSFLYNFHSVYFPISPILGFKHWFLVFIGETCFVVLFCCNIAIWPFFLLIYPKVTLSV